MKKVPKLSFLPFYLLSNTETGDENATTYCDPPDKNLTNILLSVYLACGIAAVITVALFVQRLERNDKKTPETTCGLFLATTKLMREANIVLLIPLTVYSGLEQAFITGDFTKVTNAQKRSKPSRVR